MKNLLLFITAFTFLFIAEVSQSQNTPPKNRDAGYTGESITLENDHIKMIFYKSKTGKQKDQIDGFSWAELYGQDSNGKLSKNINIYLLVRGDDIGSFHAANVGCIESYKNGIMRSVEIMPPCPWFLEAAEMLNKNPGLDVGIHLTLTSEWSRYKWDPLTHCPGLTNDDGYFFPMVWKNDNFPPNSSIQESDWNIDEVEKELRAQIELALKYLPNISHITTHMGFTSLDSKISELVNKLTKEYGLEVDMTDVKRFPGWGKGVKHKNRIDEFCKNLEQLTPGKYLFVEHPAVNTPEMHPIGLNDFGKVALDRDWVTKIFTSKKVKKIIQKKGIKLISYGDLKN